jgi:acetylornithine deacetylase/succinyl-diaminopimelate desuccinylase-like protein
MTYEYRSNDHGCLEQMRKQFLSLVEESDSADARFSVEPLGERPCGNAVPEDAHSRLLSRCAAAVQRVTGKAPEYCSASTDANIPLSLGIPATTFGLYLGAKSHTREEYIEIDSLKPGLRIALLVILDI